MALCLPLTKASEGCRLSAYADPEPGGIRWTIGYGATGPDIGPDTVWTQDQADRDLSERLHKVMLDVRRAVEVPITDAQTAALTDFVYNVGRGAFADSTMLRMLNKGNMAMAADEFMRWKYDDGVVMQGLVTRRKRERSLFITGRWS